MDSRWSDWSEWVWDEYQNCHYRVRRDARGNLQYDYDVPRGNVEGLAEPFNNMNLDSHQEMYYAQNPAYTYDTPHSANGTAATSAYNAVSMQSSQSTSHAKSRTKPADSKVKSKGKDKGTSKKHQTTHPKSTGDRGAKDAAASLEPFYRKLPPSDSDPASQYANPDVASDPSSHDPAYSSNTPPISGAELGYRGPENNGEVESFGSGQNLRRGRVSASGPTTVPRSAVTPYLAADGTSFDYTAPAQSSTSHDIPGLQDALLNPDPFLTGEVGSHDANTDSTYTVRGAQAPQSYPYYEDQHTAAESFISMREPIPENFRVHPSSYFQPGKVFKILWCEPQGATSGTVDGFYQSFRRFIVVANDEGHCTCVPILTYGRQACTKRGVKPPKHGVVYDIRRGPKMLENEPRLGFSPVAVHLYDQTEKLAKESRVNYAKLTTVEHNFRVLFIGQIEQEDFNNIVTKAVDECWRMKRRRG
ncbi:hypothetical protein C7999DRAFT_29654 [Corynascus novoguineensis]|uniref:DUF6590 domain-containing protein n=1 Tax=Corynascus novoguineensis TaxID=1126955 RepID=A0AAN7CYS5_9PEZI|nr:hypothetical protein C7999DRAFT_29654 [Corynascus novoguineensis]